MLLAAVDDLVRDASVRQWLGGLGPAASTVLGAWIEPFAAAMQRTESTAHTRAAARAVADIAGLTGAFARDVAQRLAGLETGAGAEPREGRYAALSARVDDAFREFSSSPEFDRVRRAAAAAVLDWLEHDRTAASSIVRALEPPRGFAPKLSGGLTPADAEPVLRDGNATLTAYPGAGKGRASVLVVPGFTIGARALDPDPQRSIARTLAEYGVETWMLDWGRPDETDRLRTVASQLERIDRAVDAMREAANGQPPALAGHFHGGLLALLYCIRYPGRAGALVTLSTPVEFASREDVFADWLRACDGERIIDVLGNIPGPLVAALIAASSPMRWCGGGLFALLDEVNSAADAARIARIEQARRFPPALPGETFRGLYCAFYRDNAFAASGGAVIDGHRYELASLETPLLNVFAREDRIVPPGASMLLPQWAGAAVPGSNREHPGGHFELLAGHRAHADLLPEIAAWLIEHAQNA